MIYSENITNVSQTGCVKAAALPLETVISAQRLHWLKEKAVDILVWTAASNTTSVEWHTWQTIPKATAFVAVEPTKEHPVHKT